MVPGSHDVPWSGEDPPGERTTPRNPGVAENRRQAAWRNAFREGFLRGRARAQVSSPPGVPVQGSPRRNVETGSLPRPDAS